MTWEPLTVFVVGVGFVAVLVAALAASFLFSAHKMREQDSDEAWVRAMMQRGL